MENAYVNRRCETVLWNLPIDQPKQAQPIRKGMFSEDFRHEQNTRFFQIRK